MCDVNQNSMDELQLGYIPKTENLYVQNFLTGTFSKVKRQRQRPHREGTPHRYNRTSEIIDKNDIISLLDVAVNITRGVMVGASIVIFAASTLIALDNFLKIIPAFAEYVFQFHFITIVICVVGNATQLAIMKRRKR